MSIHVRMHDYTHMSENLHCWSFYFLIFHIELPTVYDRFVYVCSYSLNKLINSFHFKYYLDIYTQKIYIFSPGLSSELPSCIWLHFNLIRPKLIYSPPSHFFCLLDLRNGNLIFQLFKPELGIIFFKGHIHFRKQPLSAYFFERYLLYMFLSLLYLQEKEWLLPVR